MWKNDWLWPWNFSKRGHPKIGRFRDTFKSVNIKIYASLQAIISHSGILASIWLIFLDYIHELRNLTQKLALHELKYNNILNDTHLIWISIYETMSKSRYWKWKNRSRKIRMFFPIKSSLFVKGRYNCTPCSKYSYIHCITWIKVTIWMRVLIMQMYYQCNVYTLWAYFNLKRKSLRTSTRLRKKINQI